MTLDHFSKGAVIQLDKVGCLLLLNLKNGSKTSGEKMNFLVEILRIVSNLHPGLSTSLSKF